MPTINSFPIQTKTIDELDNLTNEQSSSLDRVIVYDESVGVWKSQTLGERDKSKVIPLDNITAFPNLIVSGFSDRQQFHLNSFAPDGVTGGGSLAWSPNLPKSLHDGKNYFSPTVPVPTDFNDPVQVQNYLDGVGEEFPADNGVFALTDKIAANAATEQEILEGQANDKFLTPNGASGSLLRTFKTVAEMASLIHGLDIGVVVSTKGCLSIGDGGHGTFDIVDSTALPADGYSVISAGGKFAVLRAVNGGLNVQQFGAAGDYSFTSDSGTDDLLPIRKALLACAALGCGELLAPRKYLVSGTLSIPRGVTLRGAYVVGGENQTGAAVWPPSVDVGSAIVSSATAAPVVLINKSDSYVADIALGATQTRNAAAPSTGAQNVNCGLAVETDDTPTASIRRCGARNVVFMYQPADGFYVAGAVASLSFEDTVSLKCNRHGWAIDCGTISGRTNKARPGIIKIKGHRSVNLGGHGFVVGDAVSNTFQLPYRIDIDEHEGFRCGNNPAHLLRSAHGVIRGTDIRYQQSASVATSGTSGEVPTLAHCLSINGRNINMLDNRYVHSVDEYVEFWVQGDLKNDGINIFGSTLNSFALPIPNNFIKPTGTITNLVIRGVDYEGPYGIASNIADLSAFTSQSNNIEVWQAGEIYTLRARRRRVLGNAFTTKIFTIADDSVAVLPFAGTFCHGVMQVAGGVSARGSSKVHFRVGSNAFCTIVDSSGVTVGVGTSALSGTTGPDGQLNIAAATDNNLYIENRTGGSSTYVVTLLSVNYDNGELA